MSIDPEYMFDSQETELKQRHNFENRIKKANSEEVVNIIGELKHRLEDILNTISKIEFKLIPEYTELKECYKYKNCFSVLLNVGLWDQADWRVLEEKNNYIREDDFAGALDLPFEEFIEKMKADKNLLSEGYISEYHKKEMNERDFHRNTFDREIDFTFSEAEIRLSDMCSSTKAIWDIRKICLSAFEDNSPHLAAAKLVSWIPIYLDRAAAYFRESLAEAERRKGELPILPEELYSNQQPENLNLSQIILAMKEEILEKNKETETLAACHRLVFERIHKKVYNPIIDANELGNIKSQFHNLRDKEEYQFIKTLKKNGKPKGK